jgi:putative flippase GtrA
MRGLIINAPTESSPGNETITQAGKYVIVGGICTLLDFSILFVLTHFLNIHYVASSIVSFMSGTVVNYYLCTLWVFRIRVIESHRVEFFYYGVITAGGLCINTALIWSFTEYSALNYMLSKVIAAFATYWWNFGARKYFLHTTR